VVPATGDAARVVQRALLAWTLLAAVSGCDRKRTEPQPSPAPSAEPALERLYVPGATNPDAVDLSAPDHPAYGVAEHSAGLAPQAGRCPAEMVLVSGSYCIDRFEVHLLDVKQGRDLSPHYPPSKHFSVSLYERWHEETTAPRGVLGTTLSLPDPPGFQLTEDFQPRAVSQARVLPAGYLSFHSAELACVNAGKRLCTRAEWVNACRGEHNSQFPYGYEYEAGTCNVHREHHPAQLLHGNSSKNHLDPRLNLTHDQQGPLLRLTGTTERCVSAWGGDGIYDMVGNLDEWISDPEGTFLGGFYARATKAGCDAAIDSHDPSYMDYSLGARCCLSF